MTSAEREAQARVEAWERADMATDIHTTPTFNDGWDAGVEYARAEIVEAIGIEILNNRDTDDWQAVVDLIEARFSPAPPEKRPFVLTEENVMKRMPCTYVYVGQLQEASKAIARALDAASDQRCDGAAAAREVALARQRIENVYRLHEDEDVSTGDTEGRGAGDHRCLEPSPESEEVGPVSEAQEAEEIERAEIAGAAYMKGRADALGAPLSIDAIAELSEVWLPIERALVAQDRIAGPPEDNHDPHVTQAENPEDVARAVLRAAEPKLRAVLSAAREVKSDG